MSDPIDFEYHRFLKVSSAQLAAFVEPLRKTSHTFSRSMSRN
jgi:hypothetical protein